MSESSATIRVMIVGAFPPKGGSVVGGVVTDCRTLMRSSFPHRFNLTLIDSTQISNPPPMLARRVYLGIKRLGRFLNSFLTSRPTVAIIFVSSGTSLIEKGVMGWFCRMFGVSVLLRPVSGRIVNDFEKSALLRFVTRFAFGPASRILCQGRYWQEFVIANLPFDPKEALLLPSWTASPELLAVGERRVYAHNASSVKFLFLGWLEHKKGIMELLATVAALKSTHDFTLSIAGLGHAENDVRKFVEKHRLNDCVTLLGWVSSEDVPALMAVNDVLVLPSWAEGLPNVMIEAMAAGLAVVVSAVGNVPTVVEDGKDALLVEPRDVEGLRSAIERLLDDPGLLSSIAQNGHELAKREFSVEQASDKLTTIIYEVAAERLPGIG